MNLEIIIPIIASFGLSAVLCPLIIPFLRRLKIGQTIRDEGPETHKAKNGTPTMGGIVILLAVVITSIFYIKDYPNIIPILFLTLGFGIVGFVDDFIKVVLKRSKGLSVWQKTLFQLIIIGVFMFYIIRFTDISLAIIIPFTNGMTVDIGWLAYPLMVFVIFGTDTGANFTDGLDGLASSVTLIIAVFFTVVAVVTGAGVTPITGAVIGALMGFLLFNFHPASVFMGDTGSLALGGFVVATAYVMQMPLFLVIVAFIYMIEVASVILQVGYFKITKGKRLFKMAPIHHHFEKCGWKETKVVAVFTIVTAVLCLIAYLGV